MDKSYAKKGARRIPEKTLLLWAFLGGSIGAFLGMKVFHHKTLKPKFAVTVPLLMVLELVICGFCLYQNYRLTTSTYDVDLDLSDDVKIVQVSDLHNQFFGFNQSVLLKNIEACDPDIIVVTGDIVDSTHTSYSIAMDFIEGAVKIAPVYYVTGNHENRLHGDKLDMFYSDMRDLGVVFLDDTYVDMGSYCLAGIADSSLESFDAYPAFTDEKPVVMLAHEPDYVSLYQSLGADLVLTGHVHGGQIIIPGKGGLLSPDFTFFPSLYEGMHSYGSMTLIVSRGLGNSVAPVRINNYPELVVINVT
jgi:predicted MPP superfamily phosphohydrolase